MNEKRKPLILVVDDEPEIVLMLEEFLCREEFDVIAASSGPEALEMARAHPVDLVVMDIVMPEIDGVDALREMRKERPDLPAVFITAYRYATRVVEAFRMKGVECIFKPFEPDAVLNAVRARLKDLP